MARKNIGITVDEEILERHDAIRESMGEDNEYGTYPPRSTVIESLIEEWNEEHSHYLDDS